MRWIPEHNEDNLFYGSTPLKWGSSADKAFGTFIIYEEGRSNYTGGVNFTYYQRPALNYKNQTF